MTQADIYVQGFLAQKRGQPLSDNPYPDQPLHAIWVSGWRRGEFARFVGPEGADAVRSEYLGQYGGR